MDCPICQAPACKKAYRTGCHFATCASPLPGRGVRGVLLPAKVDQAAGHKYAVVKHERLLPDGHLSGRSGRVSEVLARSETVGTSGQLTNTHVQTARGVISVENPRVRSLHGPQSPDSLPGDIAAIEPCKQVVSCTRICFSIPPETFLKFAGYMTVPCCPLLSSLLHLRNICSGWSCHLSSCLPSCSAKAAGQ